MKHLSILVPDEQTTMSTLACIIGSHQVFAEANRFTERRGRQPVFTIDLVAATRHRPLKDSLVTLKKHVAVDDVRRTDLILIPASGIRNYALAAKNNRRLIDWIRAQHHRGAEVGSMCAGGFTLAATGLLEGKVCSTHWALASEFKELFPEVLLQTDQLITDEDGIYTNGGAYSFLQLLMYLVEKFYDRKTAIHCAKYFQVDLDRGLQAGFAIFSGYKKHQDDMILKAQTYLEKNFAEGISIEALSSEFATGRRTFDRRFIKATGLTPLDYLQRVKVEAAKKELEGSKKSVREIMYDVGYTDTKAFRSVFHRITGLSPVAYKSKYNRASS
ncbi:MAG: helix-turn-helix domain-containing protein [Cyclobacteriaceae bacterium]|nr:helix-turn-helix domain-containing protein [Cyclobacteriaceae bacterium]